MNQISSHKPCLIDYQDIHLARNGTNIFSQYNLSITAGQKILISGKSGSGKTTLFKLLLGFDKPERGLVLFQDMPVNREHILKIRHQIFYLSQDIDFRNQIVSVMLKEILSANQKDFPVTDTLDTHLNLLELNHDILTQQIKELSGGERQRVGLLLCFLLDRPVWLLDEPTSALDDAMKRKIADHILSCDQTILVISHDDVWKKDHRIEKKELT